MNVNFLPDDRGRKVLRIEASWCDVSADYEEILSGYARVPVPGFRFGMVPRGVIEQRLQKQIVNDLSQRAAQRLAREALRESGVQAAGRIEVSDIQCGKGQPFRFTVRFWSRPEIKLPDLSSFALSADGVAPRDAESQQLMDQRNFAVPDNPVQAGPGDDDDGKHSDPSNAAENRIRLLLKQIARQEGSEVSGADGER